MNRIVRQIDQMNDEGRLVTNSVFPLVELSDSQEKHFTMDGIRPGMRQTSLSSESPVGDIEGLGERDVTVQTYKKKIQPDKGVDTELNSQMEILNLFNAVSDALMEDILLTRAEMAWQGLGSVDGMIGQDGATAHPEIDTSHVATPGTAYSDTSAATPITDFIDAEYRINDDGSALGQAGPMTTYLSPSVLRDLKLNDDIQAEYDNTRALTQSQLADALQLDRLQVIRTKVVRRDANGNPVDDAGDPVDNLEDAARDNILEPYDVGDDTARRNIVVGAPGQVSAFMPWFLDRLAERGSAAPTGDVAVDATNGWMTQTWSENDPLVTWFKAAQEIGFHVTRGDNWYVIQDI
jgi:hypothetical protein